MRGCAADGQRVTFALQPLRPSADLASLLTDPGLTIAKPVAQGVGKNDLSRIVGTGPYRLADWSSGNRIVLLRNPYFIGPAAKQAKLTYVLHPSS